MKMGKWNRVFIVSILFVVLVGCGKDTTTSTDTDTSVFTVSTTTSGTDTGSGSTNHAPVISSLTASPTTISVGGTTALACLATDAENDPLTYYWEAGSGTFSGSSVSGATISWTAPATAGSYIISCRATDGKLETVVQVSVEVQAIVPTPTPANSAPVITSLTATSAFVLSEGTTSFSCIATDADNDSLTYTWGVTSGMITGTGSTVSWTAPVVSGIGTATITCRASDGEAEASTQASVTVVEWEVPEWTAPVQFLSSIGEYGRMNGAVYLGRLYLVWAKNSQSGAYESSYLSIFDTNTTSAVELSRSEIFGPNGEPSYPSSMAIDRDGIYLTADVVNGGPFLTALNFDGTVRWAKQDLPSSLDFLILRKIIVQDGFLYVAGDCWGQAPGFINAGSMDVIIGKFDTSGALIWISQWGTDRFDQGYGIEAKTDGLYVSVSSYEGSLTLKYDFDGNLISVIQ